MIFQWNPGDLTGQAIEVGLIMPMKPPATGTPGGIIRKWFRQFADQCVVNIKGTGAD